MKPERTTLGSGCSDPLNVPEKLLLPPGVTSERWTRLLTAARHYDAVANRGAGPMRREGEDRG